MLEKKTVSQCVSAEYCRGWNDAVDAMPRWISVDERLPEKESRVLVHFGTHVFEAMYLWQENFETTGGHALVGVTHWMPLPEAPEKGGPNTHD